MSEAAMESTIVETAPAASAEANREQPTMTVFETKAKAAPKKAGPKKAAPKKAAPKAAAKPAPTKAAPAPGAPRASGSKPHANAGKARLTRPDPKGPSPAHKTAANQFKMLGDPTRLAIIDVLSVKPHNVGELCVGLGAQSQPAVSHHLALLRHGGFIVPTRAGKNNVYDLADKGRVLASVIESVQKFAEA